MCNILKMRMIIFVSLLVFDDDFVFIHQIFEFFDSVFEGIVTVCSRGVVVSAAVELLACEFARVNFACRAERNPYTSFSFGEKCCELDNFHLEAVVHEPFCIARLEVERMQVFFCEVCVRGRALRHDFHPISQSVPQKAHSRFRVVVINVPVNLLTVNTLFD